MNKKLVIGILSCNRGIEISLLIYSLLEQTYQDFDIIIIDDNSNDFLYENTTLKSLLKLHKNLNHNVTIIKGKRLGPHHAGQLLLENSNNYHLIYRADDDVTLQQDCIEKLINCFDDKEVVASGPIYILPFKDISEQTLDLNKMFELYTKKDYRVLGLVYLTDDGHVNVNGALQMNILLNYNENISVEHLHSGFMYKKSALEKIGGYFLGYSKVGHREETDTSYRLFKDGGKLVVCPEAVAFHYHPFFGGIRTDANGVPNDTNLWTEDEELFIERFKNNFPMGDKLIERPKRHFITMKPNIHLVTVTHGNHEKLEKLIESVDKYTVGTYRWSIVNNDTSDESRKKFIELLNKWGMSLPIIDIQLDKEVSVSEARNIGTENRLDDTEYICFIDDDAVVLGKWSDNDWLDVMCKEITKERDIGAVSPIHTWFDPLKSYVLSVACLLTPVNVWEQVGGFDSVFGNKEKGTWGYEDTDWSYRLQMAGYKIKGIEHEGFPFYHEDTTNKEKTEWQEKGLIKGKELLLSKYKNNVHIVILTYGNHQRLNRLIEGIIKYTDKPYSIGIVNNDPSKESHDELIKMIKNLSNKSVNYINLDKEVPIGEARNIGAKNRPLNTEYICFIDDDSQIIGKFSENDWLRQMQYKLDEEKDIGSVSPFYFWYDPLKFYTSTTGCILTSTGVWNQIGGFDTIFGKNNSWGLEDTDWCYRLHLAGFKIKEIDCEDFPYYHPSGNPEDIDCTTGEKKKPYNRIKKMLRSEELLLSKYNIEEIQEFNRTTYPLTKKQMEVKGEKLNIGCYYMKLDNFVNIDINPDCNPDICDNIIKIEFDDESIGLILASQVVEHFDSIDVKFILSKFFKWLTPNGHLIVEVPDVGKILDLIENGEDPKKYDGAIYGNNEVMGMKHKIQFDEVLLTNMLKEAGFKNIKRNFNTSDNDEITLRLDCRKE